MAIELNGITRHVSKHEEAVDAIDAASRLIPRFNAMTFSGAANDEHAAVNRANIGSAGPTVDGTVPVRGVQRHAR